MPPAEERPSLRARARAHRRRWIGRLVLAAVLALVIGWLLHLSGVLPDEMLAGLLIGVVVVDLLRHVRRHLGGMLDGVEREDAGA